MARGAPLIPTMRFRVRDGRVVVPGRNGRGPSARLVLSAGQIEILAADGRPILTLEGEAHVVAIDGIWTLSTVVVEAGWLPPGAALRAARRIHCANHLSALGVELVLREEGRLTCISARVGAEAPPRRATPPGRTPAVDGCPGFASYVRMACHDRAAHGVVAARHRENILATDLAGVPHVGSYADLGRGGLSVGPMLEALLADAAAGRFTHVVVSDITRLSRNEVVLPTILRKLALAGVVVLCRS